MAPIHKATPVSLFTIMICAIVLFFLDGALQIMSFIELTIMKTPILKDLYYFFMI